MHRRRRLFRVLAPVLGLFLFLLLGEFAAAVFLAFHPFPEPPDRDILEGRLLRSRWVSRDEDRERKKDWYRYRIVCLGDSCTYGWNVRATETWPYQLEQRLNAGQSLRRFEVVNLGLNGSTSAQGLLRLRRTALDFSPDLVILSFGHNDILRSPRSDAEEFSDARVQVARLRTGLRQVMGSSHLYLLLRGLLAPGIDTWRQQLSSLSVDYRVSLEDYRENLRLLAEESRAAGAEVVFLASVENPGMQSWTEAGAKALEAGQLEEAERALSRATGILYNYHPRPFWLFSRLRAQQGQAEDSARLSLRAGQMARAFPYPGPLEVPPERIQARSFLPGAEIEPEGFFDILESYRQAMQTVAHEESVMFLDPRELFPAPSDFMDRCHPYPAGYQRLAEWLGQRLPLPAQKQNPTTDMLQ